MTSSYSTSESFTLTHAKYLASKVVSDLYQCSRLYGQPSKAAVSNYEGELVVMLSAGYVEDYEFGFKKSDERIVSWRYSVSSGGDLVGGDDRSGGLYARASVVGATYFNFMSYSGAWFALTEAQRTAVKSKHSVNRTTGSLPSDGAGTWQIDRSYSSAGVAIERKTFRPS